MASNKLTAENPEETLLSEEDISFVRMCVHKCMNHGFLAQTRQEEYARELMTKIDEWFQGEEISGE